MPSRLVVAKELAEVFKLLAHPDRIRLIEELHRGEQDVSSLASLLELPATRISQHLSLMKAHRLVEDRPDGRRHLYHLIQPEIASWIVEGLAFIEGRAAGSVTSGAIESARRLWSACHEESEASEN